MLYKKYMLYHPGPATQILHIAGSIDLDEEQMRAVVDICIKGATGLLSVGVNPPPGFSLLLARVAVQYRSQKRSSTVHNL